MTRRPLLIASALLLAPAACGYQVLRGDQLFGAHKIAVIPFQENETLGISGEIGAQLTRHLAAGGVQITGSKTDAHAVLSGEVISAGTSISPTAGVGARVPSYTVRVSVRATLTSSQGLVLWQDTVRLTEDFLPPASAPADDPRSADELTASSAVRIEANRRRSLSRIAENAAAELHQRLVLAASGLRDAPKKAPDAKSPAEERPQPPGDDDSTGVPPVTEEQED